MSRISETEVQNPIPPTDAPSGPRPFAPPPPIVRFSPPPRLAFVLSLRETKKKKKITLLSSSSSYQQQISSPSRESARSVHGDPPRTSWADVADADPARPPPRRQRPRPPRPELLRAPHLRNRGASSGGRGGASALIIVLLRAAPRAAPGLLAPPRRRRHGEDGRRRWRRRIRWAKEVGPGAEPVRERRRRRGGGGGRAGGVRRAPEHRDQLRRVRGHPRGDEREGGAAAGGHVRRDRPGPGAQRQHPPVQVRAPHARAAVRHPDLARGEGPHGVRADRVREDGRLLLPHHQRHHARPARAKAPARRDEDRLPPRAHPLPDQGALHAGGGCEESLCCFVGAGYHL